MAKFFCTATLAAASVFILNASVSSTVIHAQSIEKMAAQPNVIDNTISATDTKPQNQAELNTLAITKVDTNQSLAELIEERRVTQSNESYKPDAESTCLATAIYYEAKSESLSGQIAVAQVMLNRTKSSRFPETLCGVVMQPHQFSFVRNGRLPTIAKNNQQWRTARAVAEVAREKLWHPVVGNAMFFHAKRVSPHWHATEVASLGNHIFYR